jgi:DNA-binding MarR family transcriptional regulator
MPQSEREDAPRPGHPCQPRDSVDALLASWRTQRPDLDFSPVAVVARLARVRGHIDVELDRVFDAHGLGSANFAVLVTLARVDDGEGVTQRRLMSELGLTSGTISVRMDRLVEEGLVDRQPDPQSRRNTRISLTRRGRELFERVVPAHLANERRLLSALDDDEQDVLAALLGKLLVEFEGSRPSAEAPLRLGFTVAAAHVTISMRESVGLSPVPALLVRAVDDQSPAAQAGIRTGDVLLEAGTRPLRSIAALYAGLEDAASQRRLELRVLRGTQEHHLTVPLPEVRLTAVESPATAGPTTHGEHVV